MHLSWLQAFLPTHWRRCTALCLIQNILWKSSEFFVDRLRPPLAENQIPLIPPPPPPLLKKFNAKYHLWTRGNKAIMEHTARQSKSKPVLLHLIPRSPAWRNKWAEASLSWAVHGSWPFTGTPSYTSKAQPKSLYLQSLSRKLGNELWAVLYENSVARRSDPTSPFCNIKSNSTLHCLWEGKRSLAG